MENINRKIIGCWLVVFFILAVAATSRAALLSVYTLIDDNSTAVINPNSSLGMSSWTVDGVSHLYRQWFWYRVSNTAEASIDTLVLIDGDDDTLYL